MPADIEIIQASKGQLIGSGRVAQTLMANNFNVNGLRTLDVLRKDEWKLLDNVLIDVARNRLVAVQELVSRGLTYNIPNGLGTTILEWEQVTDMTPAEVSMSGVREGANDTRDFTLKSMPLPIIHKDFNINIRKLEASRKSGQPLDVAQATLAATLVTESVESMVFLGHATREGNARIYGLTTEPNRNTGSLSANWATATGAQILTDTLAMIDKAYVDNMYGPFGIFVPYNAYVHMGEDYKAAVGGTIMDRVLAVPGIEFVKPTKDVVSANVVMVQLTADVIDEVMGLQPTMVQWESNGGMTVNFKVMAIMIPRIRSTVTTQSGVVHFS